MSAVLTPTPSPSANPGRTAASPTPTPPHSEGVGLATLLGLVLHQVCHRDILVSRTGDIETAVWLRTSRIKFTIQSGGLVDVICPAELARERGLA